MKKRILIVGVRGFLGNALRQFIEDKYPQYNVYGICRRPQEVNSKILRCDLNQPKRLKTILSRVRPDYIFNLAGGRIPDRKSLFDANFSATVSLLNTIGEMQDIKPRIIIPGTAAEYGLPEVSGKKISEQSSLKPISWYGFVKHMQVDLSLMSARNGVDIVVARMFNILGKGVPESLAIGKFAKEIALIEKGRRKPVIATKNLDSKRDFLDVRDICTALFRIAQNGRSSEVYNVCSGKSYTIRHLLKQLLKFSTRKDIIIDEDKDVSSESCDIIGSNAKLKRVKSWKPTVSIDRSLKETLEYYRNIV